MLVSINDFLPTVNCFLYLQIPAVESSGPTHVPKQDDKPATEKKEPVPTTPPESTFKKLAPSRNRYTLLRDEL